MRKWVAARWSEVVVTAVVVGMFSDAVFTAATFFTRDMGQYELPLRQWWRQRVLDGHFPQWLPNMGLGVPVIANPVSQALYPFNWFTLLPFPESLDLYIVGHLVFAGLGSVRLARRLGADPTGACVAGLSYALGGYLVSMTTNPFYVCSDAYIPWIVVAMLRVNDAPARGRGIAMLALLLSLQLLSGAFQGALFSLGLGTAMVVITESATQRASRAKHAAYVLAATSIAVCIGALVAAAQLVPAMRFSAVSTRSGGVDLELAQGFSTHPLRLLNVFIPSPFGVPFIGPYFAEHLEQMKMPFPFAYSLYSGAACVVLLPIAFMHRGVLRAYQVRSLFLLLFCVWLLALGVHTPAHELAYRFVPLLDRFRFPEKFFSIASLLTALLSGLGATALLSPATGPRRLWPALLCLALPLSVALVATLWPDAAARAALDPRLASETARAGAALLGQHAALGVGVALAALAALHLRQKALFVAVCAFDLIGAALAYHRTADLTDMTLAPEIVARVASAEKQHKPMRLLSSRRDFIYGEPVTFERINRAVARPNRGVEHGVHFANSYTSAAVQATNNLFIALEAAHYGRFVRTLAVTSVVADAKRYRAGIFSGYRVVADWDSLLLLDVPNPLPRAHVVFRAASVKTDRDAVRLMTHPQFPSDAVAVFVGEIPERVPQLRPPEAPPEPRACKFERYEPEYVSMECALDEPGVAVFADQYLDGWELEVNSVPTPIRRVDVAFRGVVLPRGKHHLVYRYHTPGLNLGVLASVLGLLLLWATCLVNFRHSST